ncbi:glyoxalase [Caballeronia ptereochthonis]|uniref:Glyoxalase n=1 Tax=Caballeronia ptereochthonis TaxID=1777144 RepID=A0A158AQE6_9BURK|nr:VOC family protein [Caballeronia ptereochthonis]SAK59890.1 glyoxalase [Caballeronia ptereochthonis]
MTEHRLKLDHLVIAARTLEEGAQFVAGKFGVETAPGGAHPLMRTHNRLLNLWGGAYLEVIAIDPEAASVNSPPPRLFALDDPAMQRRLEEHGPQLVHWVARVERPKSLVRWREQYPERIPPVAAMSRGGNTWGLTVPDDGAFPAWQGAGEGVLPSLIQWDTPRHPSGALPETGIALRSLAGFHPDAAAISGQLAWLGASHLMRVQATSGAPVLVAQFDLPDGTVLTLGESAEQARAREEEAQQAAKRRRVKKTETPEEPEATQPDSPDTPD